MSEALAKLNSHSERRREQVRQLAVLGDTPGWFEAQMQRIRDELCTLDDIATEIEVRYSLFRHWIMGDTKREEAYQAAVGERKRRLFEQVEDRLFKTALGAKGEPRHADALRAAELLRNGPSPGGALPPGTKVNLNVVFVSAEEGKPKGVVIDQIP